MEIRKPLDIGKGRILREGTKVALFSYGARLGECLKAADELAGIPARHRFGRWRNVVRNPMVAAAAAGGVSAPFSVLTVNEPSKVAGTPRATNARAATNEIGSMMRVMARVMST